MNGKVDNRERIYPVVWQAAAGLASPSRRTWRKAGATVVSVRLAWHKATTHRCSKECDPFIGPGASFELMPELHLNASGMADPAEQYYGDGSVQSSVCNRITQVRSTKCVGCTPARADSRSWLIRRARCCACNLIIGMLTTRLAAPYMNWASAREGCAICALRPT